MRKKTIEQYLEIIYILNERQKQKGYAEENGIAYAQTGDIAEIMKIKAPSVSEMLQKLEKEGLILHEPYKGAKLTEKGENIAKELQLKHKILQEFLVLLGVDKEIAEIDACTLEHEISNTSMKKLTNFMEFIKNNQDNWLKKYKEYFKNTT